MFRAPIAKKRWIDCRNCSADLEAVRGEAVGGASFTFLGTSAGEPSPTRACSGHVLGIGESLSLIDCGGGVSASFLHCGFDPLKVDRIFISHTHPDHVCELPLFIQMIYLAGRTAPLELFVPEEFLEPLEVLLASMYLIRARMPFELRTLGYTDGFTYENTFQLKAIGNTHLAKYAQHVAESHLSNKMQCCSLDLAVGETKLLYSSDIGGYHDIEAHVGGHDFVILECAHLDVGEFIRHAGSAAVRQFVLTHVISEESAAEIASRARQAGITNLIVAHDGLSLNLMK
jgi:ribonuclease BN (tRNA processing enzyme)